jgi:hypothetical protein
MSEERTYGGWTLQGIDSMFHDDVLYDDAAKALAAHIRELQAQLARSEAQAVEWQPIEQRTTGQEPVDYRMVEVLDRADDLLSWCVKNVNKWNFPEWDQLSRAVSVVRAAPQSVAVPSTSYCHACKVELGSVRKCDICGGDTTPVMPVPEGWQLVPKVPTRAMLDALADSQGDVIANCDEFAAAIWQDMLAFAPQPVDSPKVDYNAAFKIAEKYGLNYNLFCAAYRAMLDAAPRQGDRPIYDACANCLRPQGEHSEDGHCPAPYTTVWHAWDYAAPPENQP